MSSADVVLGFLEEGEPWRLLSPQFPSKVGGKPAWLNQKGVPRLPEIECEKCHLPMAFLLQVYAPISDKDQCFHRTLFLFCCKTLECYSHNDSRCMKVFRSQIPRKNDFYSYDPPPEDPPSEPFEGLGELPVSGVKLCWLCGCPGNKSCSRCHSVTYCGKHHQTIHWKHSHKRECGTQESSGVAMSPFLFPEFELVTEPEDQEKSSKDTETQKRETEKNQSLTSDACLAESLAEAELEDMAMHETEETKVFQRFKKRIAPEPHQVVRYSRGGVPLWVSAQHVPSEEEIPPCSCGAKRIFELQVMPQLLNDLNVDSTEASIDWGTVAIFTCSRSCDSEDRYSAEFVWKQDFIGDPCNKE